MNEGMKGLTVSRCCAKLMNAVLVQMGRIPTTVLPAETSPTPEAGGGVPGPMGGQFGQQWDEQQFAPPQPAYQYGSPDALPQVLLSLYFAFHCMALPFRLATSFPLTDLPVFTSFWLKKKTWQCHAEMLKKQSLVRPLKC